MNELVNIWEFDMRLFAFGSIITLTLASLYVVASAAAPTTSPSTQAIGTNNAALQYWQAFALLPGSEQADAPASRAVLRYLHRGAMMESCDWGLNYDDGFECLMPHLSKVRQLAGASLAAAQEQWDQNPGAAAQIVADMLALSRHLCADQTLGSYVARVSIQSSAFVEAAKHLPSMSKDDLRALSDRLQSLPPELTVTEEFRHEKQFNLQSIRLLLVRPVSEETTFPADWAQKLRQLRDEHATDPKASEAHLAALEAAWDERVRGTDLPANQWTSNDDAVAKKVEEAGTLGTLFTVPKIQPATFARPEIEWAMFRAGVAIALEGEAALKNYRDPYDGSSPFGFRKSSGGFVLTSKFVYGDKPLSMTFGAE